MMSSSVQRLVVVSRPGFFTGWSSLRRSHRISAAAAASSSSSSDSTTPSSSSFLLLRQQLLHAAAQQVLIHGWTSEAIVAAAATLHPSSSRWSLAGLIEPHDIVQYCLSQWNVQLQRELLWQQQQQLPPPGTALWHNRSRRDQIVWAVQRRLEYQAPYVQQQSQSQQSSSKQLWPTAMALGLRYHPEQTARHLQQLIRIVLDATSSTGTNSTASSTDTGTCRTGTSRTHDHYGELSQLALGAVYAATELHMLADPSPDFVDTWTFLRHRVDEWERWQQPPTASFTPFPSLVPPPETTWYVASAVASAVASGVASLVVPTSSTVVAAPPRSQPPPPQPPQDK